MEHRRTVKSWLSYVLARFGSLIYGAAYLLSDNAWIKPVAKGDDLVNANEVYPGLWQSALLVDETYRTVGAYLIVSLDNEDTMVLTGWGGAYTWWPIADGPMPDPQIVRKIASFVAETLKAGYKVIVHCGAGINRSGLINARAMIYLGLTPQAAIDQIRERRPGALSNQNFVNWLLEEKL